MTIATPERYAEMLDAARHGGYAYPAINVTSSQTLNAALQGFAEAESDGIIQVSVGGSAYFSGKTVHDRVVGSLAFAAFAHEVAAQYPNITIALHTDHCAKQYLDEWVRPLLDHEIDQVRHGQEPTFQSHMWDGSTVPLEENLTIAAELLEKSVRAQTVLEIEIGAVGGEEDGHSAEINEKLYSTPADVATHEYSSVSLAMFVSLARFPIMRNAPVVEFILNVPVESVVHPSEWSPLKVSSTPLYRHAWKLSVTALPNELWTLGVIIGWFSATVQSGLTAPVVGSTP